MPLIPRDWQNLPAELEPLPGETVHAWHARIAAYDLEFPGELTKLAAEDLVDLEERLGAYADSVGGGGGGSGDPDMGGDVNGLASNATVERIRGKHVPAPVAGDDERGLAYDHDNNAMAFRAFALQTALDAGLAADRTRLSALEPSVYQVADLGAAYTFDFAGGTNVDLDGTLTQDVVITVIGQTEGAEGQFRLAQDAVGGHLVSISDGTLTQEVVFPTDPQAVGILRVYSRNGVDLDIEFDDEDPDLTELEGTVDGLVTTTSDLGVRVTEVESGLEGPGFDLRLFGTGVGLSNATADTAALLAACAAGPANILLPRADGTSGSRQKLRIDQRVNIPTGVQLLGHGRGATIFLLEDADSCIAFSNGVEDTDSTVSLSTGGRCGGFSVDGQGVADYGVRFRATGRTYSDILATNCLIGQEVAYSQNSNYRGVDSEGNVHHCMVMDRGAGGNKFFGCEYNDFDEQGILITQSGPSTRVYTRPTNNTWFACLIERPNTGATALVRQEGGTENRFVHCAPAADGSVTPIYAFHVLESNAQAQNSSRLVIAGGQHTGGATGTKTFLRVEDGGSAAVTGNLSISGFSTAYSVESVSDQIRLDGDVFYNSVTTVFAADDGSTIQQCCTRSLSGKTSIDQNGILALVERPADPAAVTNTAIPYAKDDGAGKTQLLVAMPSGDPIVLATQGIPAGSNITQNTQTANYTAVLTDAGKAVEMNVASANTFTVPPNSDVAFPTGTVIEVYQMGAGQTTLTPGSGVTLRERESKLKTAGQYATVSLRKRATNEWAVSGDVAA